jgi:S1-C subfamily serine protease
MKFLSKKVSVYLGILSLGGGLGFLGSSYFKQPTVVEQSQIYPTTISTPSNFTNNTDNNKNINFIAAAVQRVGPAVVRIDASRQISSNLPDNLNHPLFKRFFGNNDNDNSPESTPDQVERGTGSGFIIGSDGRLITNAHVVDGKARCWE